MTYRELLKLYKQGKLEDSTKNSGQNDKTVRQRTT